jgi:hypothetical protein
MAIEKVTVMSWKWLEAQLQPYFSKLGGLSYCDGNPDQSAARKTKRSEALQQIVLPRILDSPPNWGITMPVAVMVICITWAPGHYCLSK